MKAEQAKEKVKAGLTQMVEGLKALDSQISESEIDKVLKEHVMPELIKESTLCDTSIFNKMEVLKVVEFDSIIDEKSNGMEDSIRYMNASAICWLSEHHYHLDKLFQQVKYAKMGVDDLTKMDDFKDAIKGLKEDSRELSRWLIGDAFERNQHYEHELKELNGRK